MTTEFKPTYLMIKRHQVTGLLYFCKTTRTDPDKYKGSGVWWSLHLKKHGRKVDHLWKKFFTDKEELQEFALFFSDYFNICEDNNWANIVPEDGITGWPPGTKHKPETAAMLRELAKIYGFQKGYTPYNKGMEMDEAFCEGQSINAKKRVEDGTHNMLTEEFQNAAKQAQKQMFEDGTHPFLNVRGENNVNYDPTIHTFKHKKTGEVVQMTQSEFVNHFNLTRQNVNGVIKGRKKSVSGWVLVAEKQHS
jgi:hypothetical protein